jgi:hypothetical protein
MRHLMFSLSFEVNIARKALLWYYINILEKTKGEVSTNVKQLKKNKALKQCLQEKK